jgi:oligopeptide/dipeptide ABC transporter ATP-binding protein
MTSSDDSTLLRVEDLSVTFYPQEPDRRFSPVKDVAFELSRGEMLGMVGESGCGKSLTALSVPNLLPKEATSTGQVTFNDRTYSSGAEELSELRGCNIGMIFQEPLSALNPVFSIGDQLDETLRYLRDLKQSERRRESIQLLERVHLDRPEKRLDQYPHQLSGGQRQRVVIALALAGQPDVLIADEPTTALDVTIESRIMDLFEELSQDGLGILLISHDLSLVADVTDHLTVMYSGYTVETAPSEMILERPQHPYTQGLITSAKDLTTGRSDRLPVIPGEVPDPQDRPSGCPFHPRCAEKENRCESSFPDVFEPISDNKTACWARE